MLSQSQAPLFNQGSIELVERHGLSFIRSNVEDEVLALDAPRFKVAEVYDEISLRARRATVRSTSWLTDASRDVGAQFFTALFKTGLGRKFHESVLRAERRNRPTRLAGRGPAALSRLQRSTGCTIATIALPHSRESPFSRARLAATTKGQQTCDALAALATRAFGNALDLPSPRVYLALSPQWVQSDSNDYKSALAAHRRLGHPDVERVRATSDDDDSRSRLFLDAPSVRRTSPRR